MYRRLNYALKWAVTDTLIIFIAYTLAHLARALTTPLNYLDQMWFILLAAFVIVSSSYVAGVYHRIWGQTSGHGVVILLKAFVLYSTLTIIVDLLITPRPVPLSVVVFGNLFALVGFTAARYRSRLPRGMEWRWRAVWRGEFPDDQQRLLIVGAGESGEMLARRLRVRPRNGKSKRYQIVGFIDDDPEKHGLYVEGFPVLGGRKAIPAVVKEKQIDLLIVAIHNISGHAFREILTLCEQSNAQIKVVPDPIGAIGQSRTQPILRDVKVEDLIGRSQISQQQGIDMSPVTGKVVLITGAAGSIGSELSRQMATYAPELLLILDNNESALHNLQVELQAKHPGINLKPVLADVTRPNMIQPIFEQYRPQLVYHAAAYKHVPMLEYYPNEAVRVNVIGTRLVAEVAHDFDAERFVLISTDKAVNPSSVMGASKRLCELVIHQLAAQNNNRTLFTAVRFGNVVGSRGSVVPTFNKQLDNGGPITITDKRMTRYFMSIPEAVNLVIHAACLTSGDDIFVLRMGETVHIIDIAERMIRMRGLRPYTDVEIKEIGIRPGEKLHEELFDGYEKPVDTEHPYIFKINQWTEPYQPHEFLQRVEDLSRRDLSHCSDKLAEIMAIAVREQVYLADTGD